MVLLRGPFNTFLLNFARGALVIGVDTTEANLQAGEALRHRLSPTSGMAATLPRLLLLLLLLPIGPPWFCNKTK